MKSKRGVEAAGLSVIIGIVILLLSGWVILSVISGSTSRTDEKLQVDLCRITNEVRVAVEHKTKDFVSTPRFCNTIDKTEGSVQVPTTKKYTQDAAGANLEIREMIKNCWYMWLEGSEQNTFLNIPNRESCQICYRFRVKDTIGGGKVDRETLSASMEEPFFVSVPSEFNCDPPNGGAFEDGTECSDSEKIVVKTRTLPDGTNQVCCRKDVRFECENKGGKCYKDDDIKDSAYKHLYLKWTCSTREQQCFVKGDDNFFTYTSYITQFGKLGGDIFFVAEPSDDVDDITYDDDKIYVISFVSPSKQSCLDDGDVEGVDAGCYARVGGYVLLNVGTVGVFDLVNWGLEGLGRVGGFLGAAGRWAAEKIDFTLNDVPNFIIVSTFEHANRIGCVLE